MTNPIQYIIFGGVATGLCFAAWMAFADGPNPGTFDQCITGDCEDAPKTRERQCPPHSDTPHATYRHPWIGNCFEREREEETECTMLWKPGVMYARGGKHEKQCA